MRRELHDGGGPLYAVHFNGTAYAEFSTPNQAVAFVRGLDARSAGYFHIEDADGNRVEVHDQPAHPGHAYAVLAALDRRAP